MGRFGYLSCSIGKLRIDGDLIALIEKVGFECLSYSERDAVWLKDLPFIHRDPFDRMLITQCNANQCVLMTNDAIIRQYDCKIF